MLFYDVSRHLSRCYGENHLSYGEYPDERLVTDLGRRTLSERGCRKADSKENGSRRICSLEPQRSGFLTDRMRSPSTGCIASRSLRRLLLCSEFRLRNMNLHQNDYHLEAFEGVE